MKHLAASGFVWVALLFGLPSGCTGGQEGHQHEQDHPTGHDHHQTGHGHGNTPMVSMTLWGDTVELYAEHPVAVAGHAVSFLMHVTTLADFQALESGQLTLELTGPETLRVQTSVPLQSGIFRIVLNPKKPGMYTGQLKIAGTTLGLVEGIQLEVFASRDTIKTPVEKDESQLIEFFKEQQWKVKFNTAFSKHGTVLPTVTVSGQIQTPPDGEAVVGAPVTGRLVSPPGGLAHPGSLVRRGQTLASLIPAPSAPEQGSVARLEVTIAIERQLAAQTSLSRAERLHTDEAISARDLEEARREVNVANEAVKAAQRNETLYLGARGATKGGSWRLTAPIDGVLVEVNAKPGATVSPGETLFHIINPEELWIVAKVPEQDATQFRPEQNASFKLTGDTRWLPITIRGDAPSASLISVGRRVDSVSRTIDVRYQLNAPDAALRVGGLVQVALPTGEPTESVTIPREALIEQDGRHYVYVQVDGEHFQERMIRIGSRASGRVAVVDGLRDGERIVTEGAHLIRLADRSSDEMPHGHLH